MSKMSSLADGVKVEMVKASEMSDSDRKAIFDREASVDAIPDLDVLTGNVFKILTYLEKPETKKLIKTNESAVRMMLNEKYASTVPLGVISILMEEENKEENIDRLVRMFESLKQAKLGNVALEDVERSLTDEVNNRYLYSKYGSKDAFEQALATEVRNEQRKKGAKNIESIRDTGKVKVKN